MSKRILITDDAAIIREMIKDTVSKAGWEVVGEAENGQKAVEKYNELKPDIMTLDVVMPEFDGLYALRNIMSENPDAKVVMVSAIEQKEVLKEAFKIGAADFVVKPFNEEALLKTLTKAVI